MGSLFAKPYPTANLLLVSPAGDVLVRATFEHAEQAMERASRLSVPEGWYLLLWTSDWGKPPLPPRLMKESKQAAVFYRIRDRSHEKNVWRFGGAEQHYTDESGIVSDYKTAVVRLQGLVKQAITQHPSLIMHAMFEEPEEDGAFPEGGGRTLGEQYE